MTRQASSDPQIRWDDNTWFVTLPIEDGKMIDANWKPEFTYVVRIREAGGEEWSFGFETPITSCAFVDLKPDTEYEVQLRSKNAAGESGPTVCRFRTTPTGRSANVVPFPGR